jgi:ATP-dependent Lon protease
MYRIQTKGYETKEKLIIARKHLLPKIREQVNFKEDEVILPDETIQYIISSEGLTQKEDGVRNLKRCLEIIYTKINLFRLIKDDDNIFKDDIKIDIQFPFTVQKEHVDIFIKSNDKSNPSLFGLYV